VLRNDDRCQIEICEALARIGPPAKDALPVLEKALPKVDGDVRKAVEKAIGKIKNEKK
jgi:hypothetical protein